MSHTRTPAALAAAVAATDLLELRRGDSVAQLVLAARQAAALRQVRQ